MCIGRLDKRFPNSPRVSPLHGLYAEAKGDHATAKEMYEKELSRPVDPKAQGASGEANVVASSISFRRRTYELTHGFTIETADTETTHRAAPSTSFRRAVRRQLPTSSAKNAAEAARRRCTAVCQRREASSCSSSTSTPSTPIPKAGSS